MTSVHPLKDQVAVRPHAFSSWGIEDVLFHEVKKIRKLLIETVGLFPKHHALLNFENCEFDFGCLLRPTSLTLGFANSVSSTTTAMLETL